jgi:sugar phosphate isomerase/epimerase
MKYGVTVSTMTTDRRPATFGDGQAARHLPGIKALGFDGVDLFIKPLRHGDLARLREALHSSALEVSVIFPIVVFESGLVLSDPQQGRRREAVRLFVSQIDLAATLGAKIVLGLDRGSPAAGENESSYEGRLAESLHELADRAGQRGVEILMEPIHRYLIGSFHRVEQCLAFLDHHGLESVRLLLDTFHMNIEERSIEEAIRLAAGRIGHVHAVDNNRGAPGDGHLDFHSIIGALRDTGYDGYLSVETAPQREPYDVAARGIRVLKGIVAELRRGAAEP